MVENVIRRNDDSTIKTAMTKKPIGQDLKSDPEKVVRCVWEEPGMFKTYKWRNIIQDSEDRENSQENIK